MMFPEPTDGVEQHECYRCRRAVPPATSLCIACLQVLEQEHEPAFRRDLTRLDLYLRFEAESPLSGEECEDSGAPPATPVDL
ncbi:MAG: hypothetical protein ACXVRJ_12195 [Gaiellaceae bacterium]